MIKSMTAFASAQQSENDVIVDVEMRSINSRHLDIALRVPAGYAVLEEKIKHVIGNGVSRGRVEVRIQIRDNSQATALFEVDWDRARSYVAAVTALQKTLKVASSLSAEQIAAVPGVIQQTEGSTAAQTHWPLICTCLEQALDALDQMRRKEGDFLHEDFAQRLNTIADGLQRIAAATDGLLPAYREKLEARIAALTKGVVELDAMRIAQEAAIMADRSDISEEVVRARSHIEQFRQLLRDDEPAGRKFNFLLQELNREFNTMGAKAGQAAVAHTIVDMKSEIEKLREQVQNIE
jgi:uncharacterized protein (TIGR00255 family)